MTVTFLHTADWQIGKPFNDFDEDGGDASAVLRAARFDTVRRIAALAAERRVDAVLVAGDIFETPAVKDETLHRLVSMLGVYRGPWVLLPGNHDAARPAGVWQRLAALDPAPNIRIADRADMLLLAEGRLAVLPAPLTQRHEIDDLTVWFDGAATPPGAVRVGLAHGAVRNRLPDAAEAHNPIADDRADRARLDYLALGDWHGTLEIAPRTWYAGTPEPDRFKNNDPGNVLLVAIDGPGAAPRIERIPVARFAWHVLEHRLHDEAGLAGLDAMLAGLGAPPDRHIVRLALSGTLGLGAGDRLDASLRRWRGVFHALRVDDSALAPDPRDEDLDAIDKGGFVRAAIDALKAKAQDPAAADAAAARDALRLLYTLHQGAPAGAPRPATARPGTPSPGIEER